MKTKSPKFDPYFEWLGIAPAEQPADYYRLLNITVFEQDTELIRDQADERMEKVRRHQNSKHSRSCQRLLNELAAAKSCLLDKKLRRIYDAKLSKILKEKKLPDLAKPGKLLPEQSIPENYDPFQGTADADEDKDPLRPIVSRSIWPLLAPILIMLAVTALIIAISMQLR